MKAAVYHNNNDVRIVDVPRPEIKADEILVKVMASGICGTDVMEWYRIKKSPRILGHEIAGEIAEAGAEVRGFKPGDRVFVSHHVPCNDCKYCRDGNHTACGTLHTGNYDPGGFCEYVRVPGINVRNGTYLLPDNVSYDEGTMIEPLACVLRGMRVTGLRKGRTALILGCGTSGLMNIMAAKMVGAEVIATDMDPHRLEVAKSLGADRVVRADEPLDVKADRVILCAGAMAAVEQAFRCVDRKGIILFFAIPNRDITVPITDFWRNELTIASSYGAAPEDLEASLELIRNGTIRIADLITHRLPLDDIQQAYKLVVDGGKTLKVVLRPFAG